MSTLAIIEIRAVVLQPLSFAAPGRRLLQGERHQRGAVLSRNDATAAYRRIAALERSRPALCCDRIA